MPGKRFHDRIAHEKHEVSMSRFPKSMKISYKRHVSERKREREESEEGEGPKDEQMTIFVKKKSMQLLLNNPHMCMYSDQAPFNLQTAIIPNISVILYST